MLCFTSKIASEPGGGSWNMLNSHIGQTFYYLFLYLFFLSLFLAFDHWIFSLWQFVRVLRYFYVFHAFLKWYSFFHFVLYCFLNRFIDAYNHLCLFLTNCSIFYFPKEYPFFRWLLVIIKEIHFSNLKTSWGKMPKFFFWRNSPKF